MNTGMNPQMMINQMNNNMGNNGDNQNQNQNNSSVSSVDTSQSNPQGINVIFRVSGAQQNNQPPVMVQCMPNEKVSDIIKKYRSKSGDTDETKKFIFNAKNLNPELNVGEAGISQNANIFVVATKGIKGAF